MKSGMVTAIAGAPAVAGSVRGADESQRQAVPGRRDFRWTARRSGSPRGAVLCAALLD